MGEMIDAAVYGTSFDGIARFAVDKNCCETPRCGANGKRGKMSCLLTECDVAERLHVSLASVRRWRLEQRGPQFIKMGSLVRYRPEDIEAWLAALPTGGSHTEPNGTSGGNAGRLGRTAAGVLR